MRNLFFFLTAFLLSACNLTMPGSSVEITATPSSVIQVNADLPTPNYATPAAAQTDWVTYTNTQNGYTIQRPRSVSLVEEQNGSAVYIDDQIEVLVLNTNPEQARDVPVLQEASDMMLGQYPARRLIGSMSTGTAQNFERVIVPHNSRYYVFTLYELKRSAWNGDTQRTLSALSSTQVDLFRSILTTLRFDS